MTQRLPIAILGTGSFVPDRVITNQHFAEYLDTSDEWITTRTGIKERRWVSDDESTSTMAVEAARRALDDAGMTADQLDLIICCTATPDQLCPPTATWIQGALGCHGVASFDLSAACSGFIYGMIAAAGFVVSGMHRRVLVVGAETLSRFADPQDRTVCVLFGDAAGAAVIGPAEREDQGIWHWELGCDGSRGRSHRVPGRWFATAHLGQHGGGEPPVHSHEGPGGLQVRRGQDAGHDRSRPG